MAAASGGGPRSETRFAVRPEAGILFSDVVGANGWNRTLLLARRVSGEGRHRLAWRLVGHALLDHEAYGGAPSDAFRRAEAAFGTLLMELPFPACALAELSDLRGRATTRYGQTQLAAIRTVCGVRADDFESVIDGARVLSADPDWSLFAELARLYAVMRLGGRFRADALADVAEGRPLGHREKRLLTLIGAGAAT